MSLRALSAAWDHSETQGSTFLVLLALGDHANSDGVCWPSMDRVAARARVSRSTVIRAIEELERRGELKRQRGGAGAGSTNVYHVMPGYVDNSLPGGDKGVIKTPLRVSSGAIRVSNGANKGVTGDTQTVKNRKEPRADFVSEIPEDFETDVATRVAEVRDGLTAPRRKGPAT